jgi:N-acetylmuramoyl-L-alanine amidase
VYSENSKSKTYAERTCNAIAELGFRNRGVKCRPDLYVLKNTKAPAMLIECCFVDDKDDVALYDYKSMASAIVYGITGQRQEEATNTLYRVQVGAYRQKANAEAMLQRLKASGFEGVIVEVNK